MNADDFVLDKTENPHPVMLNGALEARRALITHGGRARYFYWRGYLQAMADATGETTAAIEGWMDRHEPAPPDPVSLHGRTPVSDPKRMRQ